MSKIRFFKSNSLRFVRLQDYSELQSDDTRLCPDFDYPSLENPCYFAKHLNTETLAVQFRTDVDSFIAYIIDEDSTETDITSSVTDGIVNDNGTTQYELALDTTAYDGYYKLRFDFTNESEGAYYLNEIESEWFQIDDSFTDHLQIEWKNSDFNPYNDGYVWATTQKLWIDSRISDYMPGVEKSVFTTENYKLITTQAQPIKSKKWEIELMPDYMYEKLNIALQHDYFYINSIRFNAEETFEIERQGDTRLYPSEIVLRLLEDQNGQAYEDYTDDPELIGEEVTIEAGSILINSTDTLLINATDELLKS